MLLEQFEAFWKRDTGSPRQRLCEVRRAANLHHGMLISGLRRVGKSNLLVQVTQSLQDPDTRQRELRAQAQAILSLK